MGWVKWAGGENPCPGKMVEIRMLEDEGIDCPERYPCLSDHLYWHKDAQIVAYREIDRARTEKI